LEEKSPYGLKSDKRSKKEGKLAIFWAVPAVGFAIGACSKKNISPLYYRSLAGELQICNQFEIRR
jgi:hypothetical protein